MTTDTLQIGDLLREWRALRRMSQLQLALEADVSQRHLSFIESGRSAPSRDMVLKLAERLDMPLRQRNRLLLTAGFSPEYGERDLGDPSLSGAMATIELILKGHEPNPALAVDRHWNLISGNAAVSPFLEMIADKALLAAPANVLRMSLHPRGLAPFIVNLAEWRSHLIERLRRQNDSVADPVLSALEDELLTYPGGPLRHNLRGDEIAVPMRLRAGGTVLSFISTTTVFGTPLDVTLSELAIETFFAADEETRAFLNAGR